VSLSWKLHNRYCHSIYPIDYLILASSEEANFSPGSPRQRKLARNENDFETQLGNNRKESVKFKETEQQALIQNKLLTIRFGKTLLLGLVMNFPWLLSFVKVFSKNTSDYIWYPFVIFHGFQVSFFLLTPTFLHSDVERQLSNLHTMQTCKAILNRSRKPAWKLFFIRNRLGSLLIKRFFETVEKQLCKQKTVLLEE
jgi:hypothetical protein